MQAIEQRQPTSQKNQVGFDNKDKKHLKRMFNRRKSIQERGRQFCLLFWFRKVVITSVKEIKDQNKNEKYLDNEGKIVLQ